MHEKDDVELDILMPLLCVKQLVRNKGKKTKSTKKAHIVEQELKAIHSQEERIQEVW